MSLTALLLAAALAARGAETAHPRPEQPADMGPAVIDVSDYPAEQQRVYRDIFLPVYAVLKGGPARAINSPLVEIDPAGEEAERRAHPAVYSRPGIVEPTRDGWRSEVVRIKTRPPCCGACPLLSKEDAQALWRFLVYDSLRRKTGPATERWAGERGQLLERFDEAVKQETRP